jgi:serine O-acetyltransferase
MGNFPFARRCLTFLEFALAIPHALLLQTSPARQTVEADIGRWLREWDCRAQEQWPRWRALMFLVRAYPEFRNLYYYRVEMSPHLPSRVLLAVARCFLRPVNNLFFWTPSIGPGLFIEHGFSTVIAASSIGRNCWINQQVTIGYSNKTDCPTIGDNVRVAAGAKVFGKITIGDNVIIGANAVVCRSVPPDCTVVGVPARIVRRSGKRVNEPLGKAGYGSVA